MKKLLLTLGTIAAVAAPVATVISCHSESEEIITKEDIQKEFVTAMNKVDDTNYSWVIDEGSKMAHGDESTMKSLKTEDDITGYVDTTTLQNHVIAFKDAVGRELETADVSTYSWEVNGHMIKTIYTVKSFHQIGSTNIAIGTIEAKTNNKEPEYFAFVANKKVEGASIDHDATGNFYYSTTKAFKLVADDIRIIAKDEEHAIKLGTLSDVELVEVFQSALVETGLINPTID